MKKEKNIFISECIFKHNEHANYDHCLEAFAFGFDFDKEFSLMPGSYHDTNDEWTDEYKKAHKMYNYLLGKKLRVTIEVIDV